MLSVRLEWRDSMIGAVMMGNTRRCCTDLELRSREGFGSHPRFETDADSSGFGRIDDSHLSRTVFARQALSLNWRQTG